MTNFLTCYLLVVVMAFSRRFVYPNSGSPEAIQALEEHWAGLQAQAQEQGEGQAPAESGAPIEAQRSGFDGERRPSEMSEPCPQDGVSDMELGATTGGMQFG